MRCRKATLAGKAHAGPVEMTQCNRGCIARIGGISVEADVLGRSLRDPAYCSG